jgi:hypothetical protein
MSVLEAFIHDPLVEWSRQCTLDALRVAVWRVGVIVVLVRC